MVWRLRRREQRSQWRQALRGREEAGGGRGGGQRQAVQGVLRMHAFTRSRWLDARQRRAEAGRLHHKAAIKSIIGASAQAGATHPILK